MRRWVSHSPREAEIVKENRGMSEDSVQASDRVETVKGSVGGTVRSAKDAASDAAQRARRTAARLRPLDISVQTPLGMAFGALAVGFLAGLALPLTPYERRKLGPVAEELVGRAQDIGGEVIEHGRAVIEETTQAALSAAQQSAQQHGRAVIAGDLEPSSLVDNAVEHGKAVLRETAEAAMQTAQASLQEHGQQVAKQIGESGSD